MRLRAVTFDMGGTLIRPWPSVGAIYAEVAERNGAGRIPAEKLTERFAAAWRQREQFHHGREEWSALVDQVFAGLTQRPPSETFFDELYERFARREAWRVYDDVKPALEALAARDLHLGVISNWDERLGPLLEQLDLRKYFDAVIISWEAGFAKPSPVIFEHAARKLGEAPESILHVGDDERHDAEGAKAAGFQAVLIDRAKPAQTGRIHSLDALAALTD